MPAVASSSSPRCLIIVPAFNESRSVGKLVARLSRWLPGYDVLVVDDGSTDDTAVQVPDCATVISMPFNLGIGGAMQAGYRYAALHGYDIAIQCDGDGQHRPLEVLRLVDHMTTTGSDLVLGSRFLENVKYRQSIMRMTGSFVLGFLIRVLTGMRITDCTSGFRAVNREVIEAFAHWYPEDYPEPEVILLLKRAGFRISEVPVRMRQRRSGASSIGMLAGMFYVLKVFVCVVLDLVRDPWPRRKVPDVDPQRVSGGVGLRPAHSRPAPPSPV
ncbi:MAG TPA: glycosyltransferase family 2 protein [Tepidisphaeraceae bacterium]|nr:glycosyltransferase family 2 protein [Tepidisphaeraceae bacterium]